ncbi:EAL domain-containing protein [Devosia sp. MC521]|nr:EAL domain-containing protein [Devosia sp. MC521]
MRVFSLLPVQFIKIDGEFVKSVLTQSVSAIVVEAVVKLAETMNARTIAESVESMELIPRLAQLGIHYGQGFALHRPEPLIS